jgi:hypothetical protein
MSTARDVREDGYVDGYRLLYRLAGGTSAEVYVAQRGNEPAVALKRLLCEPGAGALAAYIAI